MRSGNRLADEASPYLRQHAANPVDWYPWGEEAFARAREEQKPLLLSIGYASCHWCHVMAHESFEDPSVAELMNEKFVNVKVDREERPDVDAVYMAAVQALTGSGGWPLTVALTPAGEPFYGGTYFPPRDLPGAPSFTRVLNAIADAWDGRRQEVEASATEITAALRRMERSLEPEPGASESGGPAPAELAELALAQLEASEDGVNGGFGAAPKFPPHEAVKLLLAMPGERPLELALRTLRAMAAGGIRDQLGGGFARYSVDEAWRVPHFEMMLYDNAAMLGNYATAYSRSGDVRLREVAYEVVAWMRRDLAHDPEAAAVADPGPRRAGAGAPVPHEVGFFSALDADTPGGEGAFYLWTEAELRAAAGDDADLAVAHFGLTTPGPVEGANVLREAVPAEELARRLDLPVAAVEERLEAVKGRLAAERAGRPRPAVDDKVLASWNGLVLAALATAGRLLAEPEMLELARANVRFVRGRLWRDGRLWHMWREGSVVVEGLLEDYAYYGLGLMALYRATLEAEYLEWALELADVVSTRFHDAEGGGFFSTAVDAERLVVRPKGYIDAATPSENAAAAELVWWAARYRDDAAGRAAAETALRGIEPAVAQAPQAFASSLRLQLLMAAPLREAVFSGRPGTSELEELIAHWRRFDDGTTLLLLLDGASAWQAELPLAQGRLPDGEGAAAYLCRAGACRLPAHDPKVLEEQLRDAGFGVATSYP